MKIEKAIHNIVTLLLEIFCMILFFFMSFLIYDTYMVEKSALNDSYENLDPAINEETGEIDISALQEINPDVIGWLTIDGTNINYPVLQGDLNYSYLNRDMEGNSSLTGSLYISYSANRYFEDDYTIIFGHHINGGAMFGSLDYFEDEEFLNEHLTGTLITENKVYDLHIQALFHPDAYSSVYQYNNIENLNEFLNSDELTLISGSLTNISNKVLLLSTCAANGSTERIILIINMEEI